MALCGADTPRTNIARRSILIQLKVMSRVRLLIPKVTILEEGLLRLSKFTKICKRRIVFLLLLKKRKKWNNRMNQSLIRMETILSRFVINLKK